MARLVLHKEQHSVKIQIGDEIKSMCMCGLSKNKPYCDHSHRKTLDEEEGKVYVYDKDGNRIELESIKD